ncbi:FadR/GntR family transcriptional regulator [Gulosibacter sp. 10]|uniref:FadR/GntR family transcriptional regulator n=1 Tax=Gulosibacter sp. 10 TaxID=1255570 RepID=UPI00097F0867|nr:FCD domain-containing protein [Gulosibacter sp. 10]SJM64101.1 Transcriptional regulator, GntR family [Gulosibacter sp. 10]
MATSPDAHVRHTWRELKEPSITERIKDEIVRWIEVEGLEPGERLPSERQLAQALSVSRPSVREAVRALQSEGLLVVHHGRGVFVAEPASVKELRQSVIESVHSKEELFDMREVLEVPAARWAAEVHEADALEKVRLAHDRLQEASLAEPPDFDEIQRLDMDFHLEIVRASGNRFLAQTQGVLNGILSEGMQSTLDMPGRLEQAREEHRSILEAILAGDGDGAAAAAKLHVECARITAHARGVEEA